MSKICPNCHAEYSDSDNFCPKCGVGLIEKTNHKKPTIILGDANAISGGININQSKNVVTHDVHYHTTTIQERIKSEAELRLEATNLIRAKAEEILAEKGRIDMIAIGELRDLAIQQGIDDNAFRDIIKDVRSNKVVSSQELSAINVRYLHQAEQAIKSNDMECLMNLLPRLESMASIYQDDNVQYLYHLTLAIFNPQKTIEAYEHQTDENYWRTFWSIISYIRINKYADASRLMAQFDPIRYDKPEGDQVLLEAYFNQMKNDKEETQSILNEIKGTLSEQLIPFLQDIKSKLSNETANILSEKSFESGFYFQWILLNYGDAMNRLGVRYELGYGVKSNKKEAFKWYSEAAEAGNAEAMRNIGFCYALGKGVDYNVEDSFKWFKKAAETGDAFAMYHLGDCYLQGLLCVKRNYKEAFKWLRKAAEAGNIHAMIVMGDCYYRGNGCYKDEWSAIRWYREAAESGNTAAMEKMGDCYYLGKGIDRNTVEAFMWYCKAENIPKGLKCSFSDFSNFEAAQKYYHKWGMKYLKGDGVCKNKIIARNLFYLSIKIGLLALDPKEAGDYLYKSKKQYLDDDKVCKDEDFAVIFRGLITSISLKLSEARKEITTPKGDRIEYKTKKSSNPTAKVVSIWALNADPNDLSDNTYGNDSSIIVHCHILVDNMNGRTGKAVLTMSTNGVRFNKTESLTPNYDSCIWKDFRFPIYANDIINLIAKGRHQFLAQVDLYDDQNHCMASSSIDVTIKYSSGFFSGTKVEIV